MQMKRFSGLAALAVLVSAQLFGGLAMRSADAAVITWGAAQQISGTTDVMTAGTLYAATNFYNAAVTVNGVTFAAFPGPKTGGPFTVTNNGGGTPDQNNGSVTATTGSWAALPSDYKQLLTQLSFTYNAATETVSVSGLTSGQTYSLQFWYSDPRDGQQNRTETLGGVATIDANTENTVGGLGQWVSGTFTADSSSQSFTLTNSGGGVFYQAMQVRIVPEPSTLAGLGVVGAGLAAVIRRRLRAANSAS